MKTSHGFESFLKSRWFESLALFVIALVPRVLGLGTFLTVDEPAWIENSVKFFRALLGKNFLVTTTMDVSAGVTTMWTVVAGLSTKYLALWLSREQVGTSIPDFLNAIPFETSTDYLPFLRLPTVLITSIFIVIVYFLVNDLFGRRVALFSGILLALDPFFLAHSRVVHHDALVSTFMTLTLLSFMVYLWEGNSWKYLCFSGLCAGLAFLSKSSSLILAPFLAFSLLVTTWRSRTKSAKGQLSVWRLTKALGVWSVFAVIVFFVLWPKMWVDGLGTIRWYIETTFFWVVTPHSAYFVLGRDRFDPGPLFYPVNLVYRLTPLALVGIVGCFSIFVRHCCCSSTQPTGRMGKCVLLVFYIVTFTTLMTFGALKSDRYILPVFPILDILAAVGLCELWRFVQQRLGYNSLLAGGLLVAILEGSWSLPHYPYYLTYYNPLLGGGLVAPHIIGIGWGEGLDQAARYLNTKGANVRAASWYRSCFNPFFSGQSFNLSRKSAFRKDLDYVVFYINQVQRQLPDPQFVRCFHSSEPEHTVHIKGIDYAWIYRVPKPPPDCVIPAQYVKQIQFGDQILLLGYTIFENREPFDGKVRINLYWRALRKMKEDYTIYLKLINDAYQIWGQQDSRPVWDGSPTNSWKQGQIVEDKRELEVLPGTPPGAYRIEVILVDLNSGRTLESVEGGNVLLGPIEVPRRPPPPIEALDIEHPQEAVLGDKVRLLGYNIESGFRPGDNIHLTLFWQCLEEMEQSYTVFTHLVDAGGNIVAQKDNPPVDGFYPTTKWQVGEIVRDQYDILISPETPPGEYQIEVGMYLMETGERLKVANPRGEQMADRVLIGEIKVKP